MHEKFLALVMGIACSLTRDPQQWDIGYVLKICMRQAGVGASFKKYLSP